MPEFGAFAITWVLKHRAIEATGATRATDRQKSRKTADFDPIWLVTQVESVWATVGNRSLVRWPQKTVPCSEHTGGSPSQQESCFLPGGRLRLDEFICETCHIVCKISFAVRSTSKGRLLPRSRMMRRGPAGSKLH